MDSDDLDSPMLSDDDFDNEEVSPSTKYCGGRILHIKLLDFMTYRKLKLKPCSGLNLILGANGSGKSSVVCALCLGLGGKPCFAGRQMQPKDFIRYGAKKATIEIELDDPSSVKKTKTLVVQRIIKIDNTSRYQINGREVKENEVQKEMNRFNIQTHNLCQFLPQERVSEFSKMNPVQLLESMQQAVGDADLFKHHDELKKLREESRNQEKLISDKEKNITTQKNKNKQSEMDARLYEEMKKLNARRNLLHELLPLMQYKESHTQLRDEKQKKINAEAELKKLENKFEPQRRKILSVKNEMDDCTKNINKKREEFRTNLTQAKKLSNKIATDKNKIEASNAEFDMKISEQKQIKEKIKNIETQIYDMNEHLKNSKIKLVDNEDTNINLQDKINAVQTEYSEHNVALDNVTSSVTNSEYELGACKAEVEKLNNIENKKLNVLKQKDFHTYEAVMWLKSNRKLFKKTIYGPILMELQVLNPEDIIFVENHIGFRDLIAFICEDKTDSILLIEKLRGGKGWAINTAVAPEHKLSTYVPKIPHNIMREKYHLRNYIKDIITGPEPIMTFLCATYNIHNTPIGTERAEDNIGLIKEEQAFSKFYTPDSVHMVKRSKYGMKLASVNSVQLRQPQILSAFTDTTDRQKELEQQMKHILTEIEVKKKEGVKIRASLQQTELILENLRLKKKALMNLQSEIRHMEFELERKNGLLTYTKTTIKDVASLQNEMNQNVNKIKQRILNDANEQIEFLQTAYKQSEWIIKHTFLEYCLAEKHHDLTINLENEKKNLQTLKATIVEISDKYERLRNETSNYLKEAEQACKIKINSANQHILMQRYEHLPHTLPEVMTEIHGIKAKLNFYGDSSEHAYTEHQNRKQNIEENEKSLEVLRAQLEELKEKIKRKKDLWLNPLNRLIEKINETFSKHMESLNCAGQISLKASENPDDFDKYGLSIFVRFRDKSTLHELSHARHSGGECSVTTIVFILALQNLTDVPFRCVDEINQGMDEINERRMFDLVASSSGSTSQYFLLTPKLLSNLTYSGKMGVHFIFIESFENENDDEEYMYNGTQKIFACN